MVAVNRSEGYVHSGVKYENVFPPRPGKRWPRRRRGPVKPLSFDGLMRFAAGFDAGRDFREGNRLVRDFAGSGRNACECPAVLNRRYSPIGEAGPRTKLESVDDRAKSWIAFRDALCADWLREHGCPMPEDEIKRQRRRFFATSPGSVRRRGVQSDVLVASRGTVVIDKSTGEVTDVPPTRVPMETDMLVRCRRCAPCLRWRARHWYEAALREFASVFADGRPVIFRNGYTRRMGVFMGSLTFPRVSHDASRSHAIVGLASEGVRFEELDQESQLEARMRFYYRSRLDKFLARDRKTMSFRHLLVCELHEGGGPHDGEPHFHILMFEIDPNRPLRHDELERCWRFDPSVGNCKFTLCKGKPGERFEDWVGRVAHYVCKYISMSAVARIRPSILFGEPKKAMDRSIARMQAKLGTPREAATSVAVNPPMRPLDHSETCPLDHPPPQKTPKRILGAGGFDEVINENASLSGGYWSEALAKIDGASSDASRTIGGEAHRSGFQRPNDVNRSDCSDSVDLAGGMNPGPWASGHWCSDPIGAQVTNALGVKCIWCGTRDGEFVEIIPLEYLCTGCVDAQDAALSDEGNALLGNRDPPADDG